MNTSFGNLGATLSPEKVKRDLTRLGPVAAVCVLLAALVDNNTVTAIVAIVAGLGALVAGTAVIAALVTSRGRAGFAIAGYGVLAVAFIVAIVLAVR